jgi:hypothetical protein
MPTVNYGKGSFAPLTSYPAMRAGFTGVNPGPWTGIGMAGALGQSLQQMVAKHYAEQMQNNEFQRKIFEELLKTSDPAIRAHLMTALMTSQKPPPWMKGIKQTPEEMELLKQTMGGGDSGGGAPPGGPPMPPISAGPQTTGGGPGMGGPPMGGGPPAGPAPGGFGPGGTTPPTGPSAPPSFLGTPGGGSHAGHFPHRPPAADIQGAPGGQGGQQPLALPGTSPVTGGQLNVPPPAPTESTLPINPAWTQAVAARVGAGQTPTPPPQQRGPDALGALNARLGGQSPVVQHMYYMREAAKAMGLSSDETQELLKYAINPAMSKVIYQQTEQDRRQGKTIEAAAERQGKGIEAGKEKQYVDIPDDMAKELGLEPGSRVRKEVLQQYESNRRTTETVQGGLGRASIMAGAMRDRVLLGPQAVNTEENGVPVTYYPSKKDVIGQTFVKPTPAANQGRVLQAATSIAQGQNLLDQVDKVKTKLGPIAGRISSYEQLAGIQDPDIQKFATDLKSYAALQPALHGFRGQGAMREFEGGLGGLKTNPGALKASIQSYMDLGKRIQQTQSRTQPAPPPSPPGAPQRFHYDADGNRVQ